MSPSHSPVFGTHLSSFVRTQTASELVRRQKEGVLPSAQTLTQWARPHTTEIYVFLVEKHGTHLHGSHEVFGLLYLCPTSPVGSVPVPWKTLPMSTSKARSRLFGVPEVCPWRCLLQPSLTPGISPALDQVSCDFGQVLTTSKGEDPLPLKGPVFLLYQPYNENIFPVVQAEGLKVATHCGCCPLCCHLVLP